MWDYIIGVPSPSYSLIDGSDKKWRSILRNLLNHHSYIFIQELQKLSKEFALVISADYCYFIGQYWLDVKNQLQTQKSLNNLYSVRYYMAKKFLDLIETKTNKRIPPQMEYVWSTGSEIADAHAYVERLCQLMGKKDLEIIVDMVESTSLIERQDLEKNIEEINLLLDYLKDVKSGLHSS